MVLKALELLIVLAAILGVIALYKRGRAAQEAKARAEGGARVHPLPGPEED
jgi:hypothetical protein